MVKLARGGKNNGPMLGRQKPRPLFPPGELPLFGPPPAYMRRPPGPPRPPPTMGPMGYGPPPPPPPMRPPPHHMGPPMPPPPPMRHRPRPVLPPPPGPPLPLLQAPIMPPRPLPFMRGGRIKPPMGRMGMGMGGMGKRLGKPMKKTKNKKNRNKPAPKNEDEHYCESCDRGWSTPEELEEHLASHVKCEYDNCTFAAHQKIVEVHIKLQHLSGLFDRIKFSYSKEDVQKWREERKRQYPTLKNIEEKLAAEKEREDRGERMESSSKIGRKSRLIATRKQRKGEQTDQSENQTLSVKRRKRNRRTVYIPLGEQCLYGRDIVMEEAKQVIKNLEIEDDIPITKEDEEFNDDEWNCEPKPNGKQSDVQTTPQVCRVLAALRDAYGSDSQDEEDKESANIEETVHSVNKQNHSDNELPEEQSSKIPIDTPNIYIINENNLADGDKEKVVKTKEISKEISNETKIRKKEQKKLPVTQSKKFRKPTLLEMLLANEIRKERNFILQCVRYIINNNYFEDKKTVGQLTSPEIEKNELGVGNDTSNNS